MKTATAPTKSKKKARRIEPRTAQQWGDVYDLLVRVAGAPPRSRERFVFRAGSGQMTEWRFQGKLKFDGKLLVASNGDLTVKYCRKCHHTPERDAIVAQLNDDLASM